MAPTIPAKLRARVRRDAAAFYLSELSRGILGGEVTFDAGEQRVTVAAAEFLLLHVECRQNRRATRVDIALRWPHRGLVRAAAPKGDRHER